MCRWGPKKLIPSSNNFRLYLYVNVAVIRNAPIAPHTDPLSHIDASIFIYKIRVSFSSFFFLRKAQNNVSDVQQRYVLYCMWKHVYSLRHKNLFREWKSSPDIHICPKQQKMIMLWRHKNLFLFSSTLFVLHYSLCIHTHKHTHNFSKVRAPHSTFYTRVYNIIHTISAHTQWWQQNDSFCGGNCKIAEPGNPHLYFDGVVMVLIKDLYWQ